jgi:hypothetical protein
MKKGGPLFKQMDWPLFKDRDWPLFKERDRLQFQGKEFPHLKAKYFNFSLGLIHAPPLVCFSLFLPESCGLRH